MQIDHGEFSALLWYHMAADVFQIKSPEIGDGQVVQDWFNGNIASMAFVRGTRRWPVDSPTKGQ